MRSLNQREKTLLALLVIGGGAAWFFLGGGGGGLGPGATAAAKDDYAVGEPPMVRMDLLALHNVDFDPKGRDLFKYYVPPPPPAPPPPPPPPPAPPRERRPPPPPRRPPPPPATDTAPAPTFRYLGFLGPKEAKIGVFDGASGMTLARVGDVVEDDFRVAEFKFDKVVFGYVSEKYSEDKAELTMSPRQ